MRSEEGGDFFNGRGGEVMIAGLAVLKRKLKLSPHRSKGRAAEKRSYRVGEVILLLWRVSSGREGGSLYQG